MNFFFISFIDSETFIDIIYFIQSYWGKNRMFDDDGRFAAYTVRYGQLKSEYNWL